MKFIHARGKSTQKDTKLHRAKRHDRSNDTRPAIKRDQKAINSLKVSISN